MSTKTYITNQKTNKQENISYLLEKQKKNNYKKRVVTLVDNNIP